MGDFRQAREHMVESQVRTSNVSDWRILAQMGAVAREDFVAPARREVAYVDDIQWLGNRFMAPPAMLGKLLQLGRITPEDDVLVIGAGSGYTTALIAGLAASVHGIESDTGLVSLAAAALKHLPNAAVVDGLFTDLAAGQYDVIFVEGALAAVPDSYFSALKDKGRLVVPLMRSGVPVAHLFEKIDGQFHSRADFKAALPQLLPIGEGETFVF